MASKQQELAMQHGRYSGSNEERAEKAALLIGALTPRQQAVLTGMADGMLNKQIASFLCIDEKTVKMHRARVLTRLGVSHSAQAVRIAVEASFASPERRTWSSGAASH